MIHLLLPALIVFHSGTSILDSAGLRRPMVHLPKIDGSWSTPPLEGRQFLDLGSNPSSSAGRASLIRLSPRFSGDWKADFSYFKKLWPRSLADGSWPVLIAAFWRTRPDQELQSTPGLTGPAAPAMLQQWTAWLETTDLTIRLSLADLTTEELSKTGRVSASQISVGDSLRLDLTKAKFDGPLHIKIEQLVRQGARFTSLRPLASTTWTAPVARPFWTSKPWLTPGLFRVTWEAKGYYQQALLRVGDLKILSIPTDSGMLIWATGAPLSASKLIWKSPSGKADSLKLDLSSPLHLGFGPEADSGLVALVAGQEITTLRLHRPRPAQQDRLSQIEARDSWGRPLLIPPRQPNPTHWQAASLLERDAFDQNDTLHVAGWMRHVDAYGRPDQQRGDSLQWSLEPFSGPSTQRWVRPDSNGRWSDSLVVTIKGRVRVSALAAEGIILEGGCDDPGTLFRIRDPQNNCLESRPPESLPSGKLDTTGLDLGAKREGPGLFLLTQGKALDWVTTGPGKDSLLRFAPSPAFSGGASTLLVTPSANGWSIWRQPLSQPNLCSQETFGLQISTLLPAQATPETPLPVLQIGSRTPPSLLPTAFSVRLTPDSLATSLRPLCKLFGRGTAITELYTGDADWGIWGLNESEFQAYDKRRDPDLFVRIGVRAFPGLCIGCAPWSGSWTTKPRDSGLPSNCGWSIPTTPCNALPRIAAFQSLAKDVLVGTDGQLQTNMVWPATPGSWRLQVWGIDSLGRILAWEQSILIQ